MCCSDRSGSSQLHPSRLVAAIAEPGRQAASRVMSGYSILDLFKLLEMERGDRVLLDVGSPPMLILQGELRAMEGPPVVEESVE